MIKFVERFCFGLWLLVFLVSCGDQVKKMPEGHEVATQTSPDGLSKAFVWRPELGGLGATVSQPYQVWLKKGDKPEELIFEADKTDGIRVNWKAPGELAICYDQAQITYFKNLFVVVEQNSSQIYEVEIVLKKVQKLSDC